MQGRINYRGYIIERLGGAYIARTHEEEDVQLEITADSASCLIKHIDDMYACLDSPKAKKPAWLKAWVKNPRMTRINPTAIMAAQRQRLLKIKAAIATALVAFGVANGAFANVMDVDRDGRLDSIDLHALVNYITNFSDTRKLHVRINGIHYEAKIQYTDKADFDVDVLELTPEIPVPGIKSFQ